MKSAILLLTGTTLLLISAILKLNDGPITVTGVLSFIGFVYGGLYFVLQYRKRCN